LKRHIFARFKSGDREVLTPLRTLTIIVSSQRVGAGLPPLRFA